MSAIRLARGFTGRDVVVKFAGCYHGHVDALLASAGSGLATFAVPGTPGVPESSTALTLVLPYNDRRGGRGGVRRARRPDRLPDHRGGSRQHGRRPARLGRASTRSSPRPVADHGALFVSDEVMTGFRASSQGQWGLDGAVEGWVPDLMTFGKVMGGGFPAAAFGGRADVMAMLAPEGPVYQAGTLSGNPIATTAGLATLRLATDEVYAHLTPGRRHDQGRGLRGPGGRGGRARRPERRHDVLGVLHRGAGPRLRRGLPHRHGGVRRVLPRHARPAGVYLPPSAFEAWFVSAAHDDRAVSAVLDALPTAARAAAAAQA